MWKVQNVMGPIVLSRSVARSIMSGAKRLWPKCNPGQSEIQPMNVLLATFHCLSKVKKVYIFAVQRKVSVFSCTAIVEDTHSESLQDSFFLFKLADSMRTVAVWTPKIFFPLLIRPQGSQGCQKIIFFFLQMKPLSFCAKIASKRQKLQKPPKLKKTPPKPTRFFIHF